MPIYEYQCKQCGHRLEVIQRLSDVPLTSCPECGKESLRKLISPTVFRLKGTGWYETDFKNKSSGKSKDKSTGDKDSSVSTTSTTTTTTTSESSGGGGSDKATTGSGD